MTLRGSPVGATTVPKMQGVRECNSLRRYIVDCFVSAVGELRLDRSTKPCGVQILK